MKVKVKVETLISFSVSSGATPGNYKKLEFDHPDANHRHLLPNGTLILTQAREEDHGYYLCHATNGVGFDISKVVLLTVHSKSNTQSSFYSLVHIVLFID